MCLGVFCLPGALLINYIKSLFLIGRNIVNISYMLADILTYISCSFFLFKNSYFISSHPITIPFRFVSFCFVSFSRHVVLSRHKVELKRRIE